MALIYFDLGNVIIQNILASSDYLHSVYQVSRDTAQRFFKPLVHRFQKGELSEERFWKECAHIGIRPNNVRNFWAENLKPAVIDNTVLAIAERLRHAGHQTGILSNIIRPHADMLRDRGIYQSFNPIILSCDVGTRKPEQKIFQIAAEEAQTTFGQILFIDDLQENVAAARALGIDSIQYTTSDKLTNDVQMRGLL